MSLMFHLLLAIRPVAGPIGFFHRYRDFIIATAWIISFLVLFFIFSIVRRIIKNRPKPVIYPDQAALSRLNKVNAVYSKKGMDKKVFFSNIIDILREYIGKRYDVKANTMTTEQFTKKIAQIGEISKENKESIVNLLKRKDSIKFAAEDISADELKGSLEFVKKFIVSTRCI